MKNNVGGWFEDGLGGVGEGAVAEEDNFFIHFLRPKEPSCF